MLDRFFERALDCAKNRPESFGDLFESKDADPNAKEHAFGNYLIHEIIGEVDDKILPDILNILVQHKVKLEKRDPLHRTALSVAAGRIKKNAVNCLIEHKAEINDSKAPALCRVISPEKEKNILEIAEILLKHGANVNLKDMDGKTALMYASEEAYPSIMQLLLSYNADLHIKYTCPRSTETALDIAYSTYISAKDKFGENDPYVIEAKMGLELLLDTAAARAYLKYALFPGSNAELGVQLDDYIRDLAGNFGVTSDKKSNSIKLYDLIKQRVLPVLDRIKTEREERHAFEMGSKLSAAQQKRNEPGSALYRFFQRTHRRQLVANILSYAHEVTPYAAKQMKHK